MLLISSNGNKTLQGKKVSGPNSTKVVHFTIFKLLIKNKT